MNKIYFLLFLFLLSGNEAFSLQAGPTTINLARLFSKDIFEMNGVPYMQPMVESVNATSNSRFFSTAYIPSKVDKPYYKASLNGMLGFTKESQKFYKPMIPMTPFSLDSLGRYVTMTYDTSLGKYIINSIRDTSALIYYAFKTLIKTGYDSGQIKLPPKAATILGNYPSNIDVPRYILQNLIRNQPIFALLPQALQDTILKAASEFPQFAYLPSGANIQALLAGVPQLEIGSLFGTELLLRLIPPVDMGVNIGHFAFWGIGLKHSLSQYFFHEDLSDPLEPWERPFDLAIQAVYQGTHLTNEIGVTKAYLTSDATILDFNIQASKSFKNLFDVYGGFSYELIKINSKYKSYLPVAVQVDLGMLDSSIDPKDPNHVIVYPPSPEFPGDTIPQYSILHLSDNNYKLILGIARQFGDFRFCLDFNISKFNMFTCGIEWRF